MTVGAVEGAKVALVTVAFAFAAPFCCAVAAAFLRPGRCSWGWCPGHLLSMLEAAAITGARRSHRIYRPGCVTELA